MIFKYEACTPSGEIIGGTLEVESERRAEELLWQSDFTIVTLKKLRKLPSISLGEIMPTFFGVKRSDVIAFSRDLSTLLSSGIALLPALGILHEQIRKGSFRKVIRNLVEGIETGSSFSEACSKHPLVFSALYLRMIRLGEEVGNLSSVLEQLQKYMEKDEAVSSKVKGAMAYPAFVALIGVAVVIVLVVFVMPNLEGIFAEFGGELPILTRALLSVTSFLGDNIIWIIVGIAGLGLAGWLYFRKVEKGKRRWSSIVLKTPLVGGVSLKSNMSGIGRTLSTLLGSGVPLVEALGLLIQTTDNAVIKDALIQVHADVQTGHSLSHAMGSRSIFPMMMSRMVGVGEETGRLEPNLETVSRFYEEDADEAVGRLTGMIGPALIMVVGLIVAFIAVSIIGTIYSVVGSVGA